MFELTDNPTLKGKGSDNQDLGILDGILNKSNQNMIIYRLLIPYNLAGCLFE